MKYYTQLFWACLFFALPLLLVAKKPMPDRGFEVRPNEQETLLMKNGAKVTQAGFPRAIYNIRYVVKAASPEEMAKQYLHEQATPLGLSKVDLSDLEHQFTRSSDVGHTVRFRQKMAGLAVNKSEIVVHINPNNEVSFVTSSYQHNLQLTLKDVTPKVTSLEAQQKAGRHIQLKTSPQHKQNKLKIYSVNGNTRLAYEIITLAPEPAGEWHVWVDAHTGEIFKAVDEAHYFTDQHTGETHMCTAEHNHQQNNEACTSFTESEALPPLASAVTPVDGMGNVFDPDPLASAGVSYGGDYSDNNDQTSTPLNAVLKNVSLRDIDFSDGQYKLMGPWAEERDFEAPNDGIQSQPSNTFNFNRADVGFEAVNIYYHIDASMRYMNETLNCNVRPLQYTTGVQFDPHGWNGQDQSSYSSFTNQLSFGEGCVDDGEDSDVIYHELFHGIHDWITGGNLSNTEGLSEGSADYWAVSYNRTTGTWTASDPQWNWVFNWDGHNDCWAGRVTNATESYPNGITGSIHTDGQIWSSTMMQIWDQLGREATDKLMLEGLGMTGSSSNQNDAANAVFQAAQTLNYPIIDLTTIHTILSDRGYTLPPCPTCPQPSCDDGIKNGNEDGIDCGGSNCPVCPVCSDGYVTLLNETFSGCALPNDWSTSHTTESANGIGSCENNNSTNAFSFTCTNAYPSNNGEGAPAGFSGCVAVIDDDNIGSNGGIGLACILTQLVNVTNCTAATLGFDWQNVVYQGSGMVKVDVLNANGEWDNLFNSSNNSSSGSEQITITSNTTAANSDALQFRFCYDDNNEWAWGAAFDNISICCQENTSTCVDGIQNGDEVGIDCGGADCSPCPTCVDGIQNGDEVEIDCGGADCSPCPTCVDGIQNGDEVEIDCGGADCSPCPTCVDGIQNGDEVGIDCGGTDCLECKLVHIRMFLEGLYSPTSGLMRNDMNNLMPNSHPFSGVPWLYEDNGAQSNISILPNDIVDWVFVEIRDGATGQTVIAQKAALLTENGYLQGVHSTDGVQFPDLDLTQTYYIVVRTRQHLAVMTAKAVGFSGGLLSYDFTTTIDQAMGTDQLIAIEPTICALKAGDMDGNGIISVADYNQFLQQLQTGRANTYQTGDWSGDGQITVDDFNLYRKNSSAIGISLIRY